MGQMRLERKLKRAKVHEQKGELDQARAIYRSVIAAYPNNTRARQSLAMLEGGRPAGRMAQNPVQQMLGPLIALYQQGEFEAVSERAMALTKQHPNSCLLWNMIGLAQTELGQLDKAVEHLRHAVKLDPRFPDAHSNLGNVLLRQERYDDAIASYRHALGINPNFTIAHYNIGKALHEKGELDEAIASFQNAIRTRPDYADAYLNMGNALRDQSRLREAIDAYNQALSINPGFALAYRNLGNALRQQARYDDAIACFDRALSLDPDDAVAHCDKGTVLADMGKLPEAIQSFETAIGIDPAQAVFHGAMGRALINHGRKAEAIRSYQRAFELAPDSAVALLNLVSIGEDQLDQDLFARLQEFYGRDGLDENDRSLVCFSLYKYYERQKLYEQAFDKLQECNDARRKHKNYQIESDVRLFSHMRAVSDDVLSKSMSVTDEARKTPIFILGMPRSGTTLVEQIISSHSQVYGGGELPYLDTFVSGRSSFSRNTLKNFRRDYLSLIEQQAGDHAFVTDKMPQNFQYIGLIRKIFPEAKIIHVYRDPAATCWSNYIQFFSAPGLEYSLNLQDVVQYYGMYKELMYRWCDMFGDQILHVDYERIAEDQVHQTRRLIDHVGLEWEEACLHPHKNERVVQTASNEQVRNPVYKGSSEKWRVYKPFLKGAFDGLEGFVPPA